MRPADDLVDAGLISLVRAAVATLPSFHDESRSTVFEAASLQWPAAPLRIGIKGRELPVAVLMTNFPNGLMEHNDVVTFLHEFGHLMHWIFAGQQSYAAQNVMELENDVIEAPSQLLEERVWDYDTLKRCATNAAGEPIPAALVEKMSCACSAASLSPNINNKTRPTSADLRREAEPEHSEDGRYRC